VLEAVTGLLKSLVDPRLNEDDVTILLVKRTDSRGSGQGERAAPRSNTAVAG
jgi:hypothetical protein